MPAGATVFVTDGYDSGSFVWFTLQRNNYLSASQSAGVVFSRATAIEVRRRSEVLAPLVDPNWKVLTSLRLAEHSAHAAPRGQFHPLTADALMSACSDPQLGFVISHNDVGFAPLRHTHADAYRDWLLYDCDRVRLRSRAS